MCRRPLTRAMVRNLREAVPMIALAAGMALGSLLAAPVQAQILRDGFWQPDGPVYASAYVNGTLYVGGNFTHMAPVSGALAELNASTAQVTLPLHVIGKVDALAGDGVGGWFVGGAFTSVQGVARQNLAHVDARGNLTSWNPGANGEVYALAFDSLHPSALYVGGNFTMLGGQSRGHLGAVDPVTGVARAWQPVLAADSGVPEIYALALHAGYIYLGGQFSKVNGLYRFNVALVDSFGTDQAFDPDVNGSVRAIAVNALIKSPFTVTVYLGGDFTFINGQAANYLGSVDGNSGVTNTFAASLNAHVNAITLSLNPLGAPTLWVGGAFFLANSTGRSYLASFNSSGALNAWNPSANDEVDALVYANGVLYAGGKFRGAGGQTRSHLAAITTAGAATAWDPAADSTVHAIGTSGSIVIAGGEFNCIGGVVRRGLAALDGATGGPTDWDPNPNRFVTGLLADGPNLFVGGLFDSIGGQPRTCVAQFALPSAIPTSWNPRASGPVNHFLVHKGLIYVAGSFNELGQSMRPGLGAIDAQGNVTSWTPGNVQGNVYALAANSSTIFVGGDFVGISNDANRRAITGLDDVTGQVTAWNPSNGFNTYRVEALVASGASVWVGGVFTALGGQATDGLARVDTTGGHWNGPQYLGDPNTDVRALRLDGGTLYVGGRFSLGAQGPSGLAAVDVATGNFLSWNPNLNANVLTLSSGGGSVFAGGLFSGTLSPPAALPQIRLAALTTSVTGVGRDGPGPGFSTALRLAPNPARTAMVMRFVLSAACPVDIEVFTPSGRCVRTLGRRSLPAGEQALTWDGRDDAGQRVPPGLYLVRVRAGTTELTAKALCLD